MSNQKMISINKLRKIAIAVFIFLFLSWLFFFKMISPGYVGVVVDLFGSEKGVERKELQLGMHWIAPWKKVYQFPIFEQNVTWEGKKNEFSFQTCEGMAVTADVGCTFHLRPECIPNIFARYRRGMDEITDVFVRNHIRDGINRAASKMRIEDLYGEGKEEFLEKVKQSVENELSPLGIDVSHIYLIGRFHFAESVIEALNSKIQATQRAQQRENELREAEAEAKKQIAQAEGQAKCVIVKAESEAKANHVLSQSVTKELIQWQAIQKWNGVLPTVTSDSIPLINLGDKK